MTSQTALQRRQLGASVALLLTAAANALFAAPAAEYPTKPVRLVAGNAPGAATDTVARIFAAKMSESREGRGNHPRVGTQSRERGLSATKGKCDAQG